MELTNSSFALPLSENLEFLAAHAKMKSPATVIVVATYLSIAAAFRSQIPQKIHPFRHYKTSLQSAQPVDVDAEVDQTIQSSTTVSKKYPIGSQPKFSLPDDSTIETPTQQAVVAVHFLLFFWNVVTALSSYSFASVIDFSNVVAIFLISIILGDFGKRMKRELILWHGLNLLF